MGTSCQPGDVEQLREQFPAWEIESRWISSASAADRRLFLASKGDVTVAAWAAGDLAAEIQRQETRQ
jgi:hypothetical protein